MKPMLLPYSIPSAQIFQSSFAPLQSDRSHLSRYLRRGIIQSSCQTPSYSSPAPVPCDIAPGLSPTPSNSLSCDAHIYSSPSSTFSPSPKPPQSSRPAPLHPTPPPSPSPPPSTLIPTLSSPDPYPLSHARLALLALDVEYTHVRMPCGRQASFATWVCLVDRTGGVPLKSYCALPADLPPSARAYGGVPPQALRDAPSQTQLRATLLAILAEARCRTLVGHGLFKDLSALGIDADADLLAGLGVSTYDTMSYGKFQGRRGGAARPLGDLAREFLGRTLAGREGSAACVGEPGRGKGRRAATARRRRQEGCVHDPEEDALAVVDLYVRYVDYEYMVEYETARLLASANGLRSPDSESGIGLGSGEAAGWDGNEEAMEEGSKDEEETQEDDMAGA